jgi:mitochondrial chaperone BCS1
MSDFLDGTMNMAFGAGGGGGISGPIQLLSLRNNLEQAARTTLFQTLRTGHWFTDAVTYSVCLYAFGVAMNIVSSLKSKAEWITDPIMLFRLFRRLVHKTLIKMNVRRFSSSALTKKTYKATIPMVSEGRELNDLLYDAMRDFCCDLLEKARTDRRIADAKKIESGVDLPSGAASEEHEMVMIKDKHKEPVASVKSTFVEEFELQGVVFHYRHDSPLMKIHTDRERERPNNTITISCEADVSVAVNPIHQLATAAVQWAQERAARRGWSQKVYVNKGNEWQESSTRVVPRKLDTVILAGDLRERIVKDLDSFASSEAFYGEVGKPYTRRYLMHGQPRTGKTSLIKALANDKKRHIHYLHLPSVQSDEQLQSLLGDSKVKYNETIVLIEDIDCASDAVLERTLKDIEKVKRDEAAAKLAETKGKASEWTQDVSAPTKPADQSQPAEAVPQGITLAGLLNVLDGVLAAHGQILIMTTNHRHRLDKALLGPGRVDKHFEFKNADKSQFQRLYTLYFKKQLDITRIKDFIDDVVQPAEISTIMLHYHLEPEEAVAEVLKLCHQRSKQRDVNMPFYLGDEEKHDDSNETEFYAQVSTEQHHIPSLPKAKYTPPTSPITKGVPVVANVKASDRPREDPICGAKEELICGADADNLQMMTQFK